eukprot:CAMPEP_0116123094 /NCGR_PEP_ID=MMETSP0329-20121206/4563_1 /TAXON_ID=697910 /ORGANISM="Pseudo-nitzschia arenysensis, Strain B593" /LENGTH=290 /DNA_ID=CAMNT_0003616983 /DNA_START=203 /DNA_END=1075 /DNA_ORIENTATION=+
MAGHNKWSKIRHKKGANDVKKALALGKASKSLTMIAKECKGDRSDPRLQAAIQHAKLVKLPKDRIEDAIERASGSSSQDEFFPLRFDAMMRLENSDSGESVQVACIVTALSDNRNRTTQHMRHLVTKHGGEFLPTDHLNYLFEKVGHIEVQPKEFDENNENFSMEDLEEELMECALEAGATNVEEMENDDDENDDDETATSSTRFVVTTAETDLWKVARAMTPEDEQDREKLNYTVANCEHRYVLKEDYGSAEYVDIQTDSEAHERLGEFLDKLEEDEDVDKVYHNAALV